MAMYYCNNESNEGYQVWSNYPPSPELSSTYPYQTVALHYYPSPSVGLYISDQPIFGFQWTSYLLDTAGGSEHAYHLVDGEWQLVFTNGAFNLQTDPGTIYEANHDIYTDNTLTSVKFSKTTSTLQDAGTNITWHRVR